MEQLEPRLGAVIQLNAQRGPGRDWGGLLCIVDKLDGAFLRVYALVPQTRGEPPTMMPIRVGPGEYTIVGYVAYPDWVER